MSDIRILIDLFSKNWHTSNWRSASLRRADTISAIIKTDIMKAFHERDYEALLERPHYTYAFNLVTDTYFYIRDYEEDFGNSPADQALQCLNLLKSRRGLLRKGPPPDEYHVAATLIEKTLFRNWPEVDRAEYERRRAIIEDWNDYFISYTNRNAGTTNKLYKELVEHEIGEHYEQEDNCVARALAKYVDQENLKGFIDYMEMDPGDVVEEKILKHAGESFSFIQLVEKSIFKVPDASKRNWCWEEYKAFCAASLPGLYSTNRDRLTYFILAGGGEFNKVAPTISPADYQTWIDEISRGKQIILDRHNSFPFETLRDEIIKIATKTVATREALLDEMLMNWEPLPDGRERSADTTGP